MEEPLCLYRSVVSEEDPGLDPELPRALVHEKTTCSKKLGHNHDHPYTVLLANYF